MIGTLSNIYVCVPRDKFLSKVQIILRSVVLSMRLTIRERTLMVRAAVNQSAKAIVSVASFYIVCSVSSANRNLRMARNIFQIMILIIRQMVVLFVVVSFYAIKICDRNVCTPHVIFCIKQSQVQWQVIVK